MLLSLVSTSNPLFFNLYRWHLSGVDRNDLYLQERPDPGFYHTLSRSEFHEATYLVNLASAEYFAPLKVGRLLPQIVTPVFKERKGDTFKVVAVHAKRARSLMARFIIQHEITNPERLRTFD